MMFSPNKPVKVWQALTYNATLGIGIFMLFMQNPISVVLLTLGGVGTISEFFDF